MNNLPHVSARELRVPSIELALGSQFNECSIAAADANRQALSFFESNDALVSKGLYYVEDGQVQALRAFPYVSIVEDAQIDGSWPLDLGLVKLEDSVQLCGVVRDDIAFPLVCFKRRQGAQCDYVQIGDEMTETDLIVTPEDEQNRKHLLELIREVIDVDPLAARYAELFRGTEGTTKASGFVSDTAIDNELYGMKSSVQAQRDRYAVLKREMPKQALFELELISWLENQGGRRSSTSYDQIRSSITQKHAKKYFAERLSDLRTVDLDDIESGRIKGTQENKRLREILLIKALQARGVNPRQPQEHKRQASELAKALGASEEIDSVLGPYDIRIEKAIRFAGRLALQGGERRVVVEDFHFANTRADTIISVSAEPNGHPGSFIMRVAAIPLGMGGEQEPVEAGRYQLDKLSQSADLAEQDRLEELNSLISILASPTRNL